jgi:23S rRNA-/tRNA-specific pseudouridylate synthase
MHLLDINFFYLCPFFLLEHSQVLLDDGKAERVILAYPSGVHGAQEALTEYRVLGPTINGCSWLELRPLTGRKHQIP